MMTSDGLNVFKYKDIDYTLKKSHRKTTSIYIERDGSVSVLVPAHFEQNRIEQILEQKRSWIYKNLAEWEDLNRTRIQREYVNGESFLYLGRQYRLQIVVEQDVALKLKHGQFLLLASEIDAAGEHFKHFYKLKLQNKVKQRIEWYAPKMGVEPTSAKVMELQNRWGSCSARGVLNFHWKCAMLPMTVLDYVVVHELAHIEHPNHSPAFWRSIEKAMPGYEEQINWLKFNGAGMSL